MNRENQKAAEKVLKTFLLQMSQQQKTLLPEVLHHLSIVSFYKLLINRKLPNGIFLQKLFLKGFALYFKKLFFKKRII
jgi:hypothetical protein